MGLRRRRRRKIWLRRRRRGTWQRRRVWKRSPRWPWPGLETPKDTTDPRFPRETICLLLFRLKTKCRKILNGRKKREKRTCLIQRQEKLTPASRRRRTGARSLTKTKD